MSFQKSARWAVLIAAIAVVILWIPLPRMKAVAVIKPAVYQSEHMEGKLLAPQIRERRAFVLDWLKGQAAAVEDGQEEIPASIVKTEFTEAELAALAEFNNLPYDIPPGFYTQVEDALKDPHTLMELLALWSEHAGKDITQGKTVMGFGAVDEEGRVYRAGDIPALTLAAKKADPDALIVPVDAFTEVKDLAPGLLVIPVSHFEEALFVLDQPVALWPISNFGLFCH